MANVEMKSWRSFFARATFVVCCFASSISARERWTVDEAKAWQERTGWLVGCNYAPRTAINQLEMWQADTFDPKTIDQELEWAEQLGFNSIRVFLHHLVWEKDREGLHRRLNQFLDIAHKHKIGVMLVLFDGVWDPHPVAGKQREPKPYVHNSGWVQSPGADILRDDARIEALRPYVVDIITQFKSDPRVQVWDLFNEPDNPNKNYRDVELANKAARAEILLRKCFEWARSVDPVAPLTAGIWVGDWSSDEKMTSIDRLMTSESDVISYHTYDPLPLAKKNTEYLKRFNRPLLCTEFMARGNGSTFDPHLGYFKSEKVSAYCWGFVSGKTQTIYPWDSWKKQYTGEPDLWFHDIFRPDGSPYKTDEVDYIRLIISGKACASKENIPAPSQSAARYQNPILTAPSGIADPHVVHHDGIYYLYATTDGAGYDVYTSVDLVQWKRHGRCYEDSRGGLWAPDVFHHEHGDRKWYLYYTTGPTLTKKIIGVAASDSPLGPFVDQGSLIQNAIDAHLFRDTNGKLFLYYVSVQLLNHIKVVPMRDPKTPDGDAKVVILPLLPWERTYGAVAEGPWMIQRGDTYYMMYSGSGADGPDYAIGYATAKSPLGPFRKYKGNPIARRSGQVFGPGHHCVVKGPRGDLWMVYHQKANAGINWDRFLALDPIEFDQQGVLKVNVTRGESRLSPTASLSCTIVWDRSSLTLVEASANYGRIVRHPGGTLFACYDRHRQIWVEQSQDDGKSWAGAPTAIPRPPGGDVTNAELLATKDGQLLCFFNHRPLDGVSPYAIFMSRSADEGRTWSESTCLFAARATWSEGCWEPAAIEHPSGEIQLFFANESPFPNSPEQEIAMMRSLDQGLTWEPPRAVIFRAKHRDGMPVPCVLQNGSTAVTIEDNGLRGPLMKPAIAMSSDFSKESTPISGISSQRWSALRKPMGVLVNAGAPYLRQMPTGETILSFQRADLALHPSKMVVCVGTSDCRDFESPTEPFRLETTSATLWNSLFVKSSDTLTAVTTTKINGVAGLWAIDGTLHRSQHP